MFYIHAHVHVKPRYYTLDDDDTSYYCYLLLYRQRTAFDALQ